MKIFDYLRPECVAAGLAFESKKQALEEIARLAVKSPVLKGIKWEEIAEGLEEREKLGSTGFGNGIAIPHCRMERVSDFVIGLVTLSEGMDFDAIDKKKVNLIMFIIAPARESNEHLRVLSAISRTLKIPGALDEMLKASTPEALRESYLRHSRDEVDTKGHTSKFMFHTFVQDEKIFKELLNVFASMESTSVTVVESKNSREYLAKMPLFAGLWSDSYIGFSKIIIAAVEKTMTNETIRQIESVTGRLDDCRNVMVVVQDLFYAAGSIEA